MISCCMSMRPTICKPKCKSHLPSLNSSDYTIPILRNSPGPGELLRIHSRVLRFSPTPRTRTPRRKIRGPSLPTFLPQPAEFLAEQHEQLKSSSLFPHPPHQNPSEDHPLREFFAFPPPPAPEPPFPHSSERTADLRPSPSPPNSLLASTSQHTTFPRTETPNTNQSHHP